LQYWDEAAYLSELMINEPNEALAQPGGILTDSTADAAAAAEREGFVGVVDDTEVKDKKRKAEAKTSEKTKKATPAHLQFWSNRHAELHGLPPKQDTDAKSSMDDDAASEESGAAKQPTQSYANLEKMCCYLCSRQFKTVAEVNKHERLSQLHRTNLENDELVRKALAKLVKAGIDPSARKDEGVLEYRDRAKERRQAFGPSKPVSLPMKKDQKSESAAKDQATSTGPSKGAALLGKMGWSQGQGLGASGSGVTAPIDTDVYAAGVGLGAEGGKLGNAIEEAGRNTKDNYADFVQRAKDKAKERFEQMSHRDSSS
jgi:RNA-binding protein 5/10